MFERFTEAARGAVVTAQEEARRTGADGVGAEHVLYGVAADPTGPASTVLDRLGVHATDVAERAAQVRSLDAEALGSLGIDLAEVRRRAEDTFGPGALDRPRRQRTGLFGRRSSGGGHLPFSAEAKHALELSLREAVAREDRSLDTGHLLLGLLRTEQGTARRVLEQLGVHATLEEIRAMVLAEQRPAA
jgi:ATP-dependent Clp protease ATP-binding subunit ClpA